MADSGEFVFQGFDQDLNSRDCENVGSQDEFKMF